MTVPGTLVEALRRASEAREVGPRFVDRTGADQRVPWSEVVARAARTAAGLRALGVRPGDRVAIVLPTGPEFFDAFFGAIWMGAVPAPLYPPVRLGRLDEYHARTGAMLEAAGAVVLLTEARIARMLGETVLRYRPSLGVLTLDRVRADTPEPPVDADPDALAFVQFSSGTTVDPKPVALSHRAVMAQTAALVGAMHPEREASPAGCSWLPLYHDMGLIGCVFPALCWPADLWLIGPEVFLGRPALWLQTLSRSGAFISPAPNFAYALCLERVADEDLVGVDLSRWRIALNGAEPVSADVLRRFYERFSKYGLRESALSPVYGLSEASLAVTFSDLDAPFRSQRVDVDALRAGRAVPVADGGADLVSVGRPLPGFAVEIRGPGGPVDDGVIGRIHAAGPSLLTGYLGRAASPVVDGWLDTGDLGFVLDGELYVTGRAKDVVILRGQNFAPHEIELAVDQVAGVRVGCAAAVGEVSDAGEQLLVFVEARDPAQDLAERVRAAVLAATGANPSLVVVLAPGTLPRTSSGKIRRGESLRQWRAGTLTPPDSVTPWMLAGALGRSALGYLRARWLRPGG